MMNKKLAFILLSSFFLIQSAIVAQPLRLVNINRTNNSFIPKDTIPNVGSSIFAFPDVSEFDQVNNHFLIRLKDASNQDRLYTLDATTGSVISNPILPVIAPEIYEYQFDDSTGILYGLYTVRHNAQSLKYCLVTINSSTGVHSIIDTINGVTNVDYYQGHTVFDSKQGHYIFSSENSQPNRLYSIDVNNGNIVHSPLFPNLLDTNDQLKHLEFDDSTGTIYGLLWDASLQSHYLVTVDPTTGLHALIDSIPGLKKVNPLSHRVTFDPINRLYIFQGQEANSFGYLYSINAINGSIVSKHPFSRSTHPDSVITPYYLHVQYSTGKLFGITWMNNLTTNLIEGTINDNINVYPNPFSNQLNIKFKQVEGNIELYLFDIRGNLIYSQNYPNSQQLKLTRNNLAAGVYFLQLRGNNSNYIQKVVIQ